MVKTVEITLLLGVLLSEGINGFNFFSGVRVNKPYGIRNGNGLHMVTTSVEPPSSSVIISEDPTLSAPTFATPPESEASLTFDPVRQTHNCGLLCFVTVLLISLTLSIIFRYVSLARDTQDLVKI